MNDHLQQPPLADRHLEAGAKLAPFAGWSMPLEFVGTLAEHRAVRSDVGAFDVSHLGTVEVTGPGALASVSAAFTNDATRLEDGTSQYTLCCAEDGGIADDLIVYRLAADRFLAVPNAANTPTVVGRLAAQGAIHGAVVDDASTTSAVIAVQGPAALATASEVLGIDVAAIPYLGIVEVDRAGDGVLVCRTGYTGEPGCELVIPAATAGPVWDALLALGAAPCGLGARDTLRLEMGYPLHGNDIDASTDPFEARLGWAVALDRGDFVGRSALVDRRERGTVRRLWGLRGQTRRPLRRGHVVRLDGRDVGTVTSGSFSPTLGLGIGLAYLAEPIGPGEQVSVDVRGREEPVEVVRPPFVTRDPRG